MSVLIQRCDPLSDGASRTAGGVLRVQQLTEGVVSVERELSVTGEATPRVHLLVGDGTKPPIDFAFHERDGRLLGVQVVLQDEVVRERPVFGDALIRDDGAPVADLTPWRDEEQILDEMFTPIVAWESQRTLAVRVASTPYPASRECGSDQLRLVLDERGIVLGARLTGFSDLDIATLARPGTPMQHKQ